MGTALAPYSGMATSPILSSSAEALEHPVSLVARAADPLGHMADVRCAVDFILGTGTMTVRECLRLRPNGVIALTQSAGADLKVDVHGVAVATGEIVIIDDTVALRICRILPPEGTEPS
jgi:flagellar motor switch/type III secretory pathway protein FliN